MIEVGASRAAIVRDSGVTYPNPHPYDGIAVGMVLWNEAHRLPHLLDVLQPWFEHIVIVVQASTDQTLQIARDRARPGDKVVEDAHRGTGDASMPMLLRNIEQTWAFVVAGDELPDEELLGSLWHAVWVANENRALGVWVEFISIIEGVGYQEQHGHLRLFRTILGWPDTMHSRPRAERELWWPFGKITHERSLDEMVQDYLRIYALGRDNPGWEAHNRQMLHDACEGVAAVKGRDFVEAFSWWPEVKAIAYPPR